MALKIQIVTPRGVAHSGEVADVQAPGELGEFGVLPGHIPVLTALRPGTLTLRSNDGARKFAIGAGFAEAGPDRVVILTESCGEA